MKSKEEIIKEHFSCTCNEGYTSRDMVDPTCVLHYEGGEIELCMSEYASQVSVGFAEWIAGRYYYHNEKGWSNFETRGYITTSDLFTQYLKTIEQ